ncbi:MAG: IS4 family transposase [Gemmataceae bacterium]|nr:IS4 family transposase [Gemmataceae bacterium]
MQHDAGTWAESEFRGTPGLNARFQTRLVQTAAALATRPQGTLPHRFTWAELKGAYRLVHAVADPDSLQDVHRQRTRERMAAIRTPILLIHDTTQLDFRSHPAVADQLGPIGDGADGARGFLQHNSLAVDPAGSQLLGLIHQQTFLRTPRPEGETRAARYRRADRESAVWTRGIAAVGRPAAGTAWVHVGDRGADFFGAMATARATGTHFLFRLAHNRKLQPTPDTPDGDDPETHLLDAARRVAAATTATVEVTGRGGRPGRTATVKLGATRLTIRATRADPLWRSEPAIALTVVRIWEENPPPDVEPLEWILGTDLAEASPEALVRYQSWYEWRWRTMEEYHKVQKTGCRIEDVRFETKERLRAAIALISVVAVRMLNLRWARESCPDASASAIASVEEIEAVELARPGKPIVTVKQFVDRVAGLGGFLGRKCDGRPGWQALWRGYQRLADILLGFQLARSPQPARQTDCG